jgi:hypothetical protein
MRTFTQFLGAMLYGAALFALVTNGAYLIGSLSQSQGPGQALPVMLLALAIILTIHYRFGWPPFRR